MHTAIPTHRADISPRAPKIVVVKIKPTQIGMVIGSGGKTINDIRDRTSTEIQIDDDGTVFITGKNGGAEDAAEIIKAMTREFAKGERIDNAEVVKITDFGAFVKLNQNTEGLVHISEIAPFRIDKVESLLHVGDKVSVIVKDVDDMKRLKLSIKDIDPNKFTKPEQKV
jgi:polyribonucleotide nucleotidyltransferase